MKRFIIITGIVSVLLSACGGKENKQAEADKAPADSSGNVAILTEAQVKTAGLQTDSVHKETLASVIKVNGSIDVPPQNMVSVSVPLGGYLRSTDLLPGEHVSKGQVIAVMEDMQYIQLQQDYLTAKSQLAYDEQDYRRQKELNKNKASSDKVFQQAETKYNNEKVMVEALAQKLRLLHLSPDKLAASNISKTLNVYSPINGFVSRVNVNIGKYVTPTDVLFELVNPSDIHLNLVVFEKDVQRLSIGQHLYAYTNNQPDQKHLCEIILISKDLSPERTVEVHCHFEDYDKSLLPGMYMNADIETNNRTVSALPDSAVVDYQGKEYVFTDEGNYHYQLTEVMAGVSQNNFTEIRNASDLNGKRVVTAGAYTVLMKLKNTGEDEE